MAFSELPIEAAIVSSRIHRHLCSCEHIGTVSESLIGLIGLSHQKDELDEHLEVLNLLESLLTRRMK